MYIAMTTDRLTARIKRELERSDSWQIARFGAVYVNGYNEGVLCACDHVDKGSLKHEAQAGTNAINMAMVEAAMLVNKMGRDNVRGLEEAFIDGFLDRIENKDW